MKRFVWLIVLLGGSLLAGSCVESIVPDADVARSSDIPFAIDFSAPNDAVLTRSMVSGTENTIWMIQLVCFDNRGQYLGIRTLRTTPTDYGECVQSNAIQSDKTQDGRLIGRVPEGTARIHFIANRDLETPLAFTSGTSERVVMSSLDLTTAYNETGHQEVVYWGYHSEANAEAMKNWLQVAVKRDSENKIKIPIEVEDGATPNSFYMIRDRARLKLEIMDGVVPAGTTVTWLVHNGRSCGLIAPCVGKVIDGTSYYYHNEYTDASGTYAIVQNTEYTDSGRYTLYRSATDNEDAHFDPATAYQYVFDDSNELTGTTDGRIKIIIKLTTNGTSKYMVVLLRSEEDQLPITRNNTYVIKLRDISGYKYNTLQEAINGDEYANSPIEVDKHIASISNAQYTLKIAIDEEGTTYKLVENANTTLDIPFEFLDFATGTPIVPSADGLKASDFDVFWEDNSYASWTVNKTDGNKVVYDASAHQWNANITIGGVGETNQPLSDYLVIRHIPSGLTRYVHVYAVEGFDLQGTPTFEKLSTEYVYPLPGGGQRRRPVYKLSFKLPDTYGEDMYPINIRFATSTLDAFSDNSATTAHGTFGVEITTTNVQGVINSTVSTEWNYKATSWDYWYIYSIPSYPEDGNVTIYFADATDKKGETNPTSIGLFLDIPHFGAIKNYHASRN